MGVEQEYDRGGALAYLSTWDVHAPRSSATVYTTGIVPFGRLVEQVMTTQPYASAQRVYWSWTTAPPTAAPPPSGCA